ncbi:hypothetical protein [Fluviicola sp.]|jgi:hypothetical protein|uniref:hypothetical protein n=1 Tax=Fluviicola sp. TaxID=1917219 RepID=UPI00281A35D7|nr:hypothetical protein [Fluviicola sp.]MDR0803444.1 hypothetical protein [Fluviicola sp.]
MNRKTIAIVLGIIIGGLFVALGDSLSSYLFPLEKPYPTDRALIAEFIETEVPLGSKLVIVINWVFSAFIAAVVSTFISGRTSLKPMIATIFVLNVLALIKLMLDYYPNWMTIACLFAFIPTGFVAYFLIHKKKTDEAVG